jgi:hypothetical protein
MTVTITAVPSVQGGIESPPAPSSVSERPLADFVSSLHNGPADLASPAALASELFSSLRGYFERARNLEKAPQLEQSGSADGDYGVDVAATSVGGDAQMDLHGGPARQNLEPADGYGGVSSGLGVGLAQLRRAEELALRSMKFTTETTLVAGGTSHFSNTVNTLLKGQ